ncbi:MAG: hypothetical protein WCO67_02820 [Betaproteobacteria bacterium]
MNTVLKKALAGLTAAAAFATAVTPQLAHAVLQREGPVDPSHGFPAWYQDRNGIALELCTINNPDPTISALLVNSGQCAVANAAPPNGIQAGPEAFPNNFATEHFYTLVSGKLATAGVVTVNGNPRVVVNMGLEGSFSTAVPTAGMQIKFSRWRVQHFGLACTGTYTYYTPNNAPQVFDGVAGDRVFQTFDVGLANPADVLTGHMGPFLQWSDVPGGAVKAPFIGPDNKKYLSDATLTWAITGSTIPNGLLNNSNPLIPVDIKAMPMTNYIAVMGPGVSDGNCAQTQFVSTSQFSLMGRYFEGPIASRNSVDRATYRAVDVDGNGILDTFQIGTWTTATQEAGRPVPQMSNRLWYTDPNNPASTSAELGMTGQLVTSGGTPPAGIVPTPTYRFFEGNTSPTQVSGTTALPGPVWTNDRVRVLTDTPATSQDVALVDEVRVTQAVWNATAKTLTVAAESGAYLQTATPTGGTAANAICSTPCLQLDSYGLPTTDAANAAIDFKMKTAASAKTAVATIVIPNVQTPPAYIRVTSTAGGAAVQQVKLASTAAAPSFAFNADTVTVPSGTPVTIDVLANDIGVNATPTLTICTAATGGTCAVPNPATACTVGTASPQCTALGGRISLVGNRVQYVPPVNRTGVADTFYYQAATVVGPTSLARAQVTANIVIVTGAPDARDDINLTTAANRAITVDVLANDFAPAGVNIGTLTITQGPCNLSTGTCSLGTANFTATPGKLTFTPPAAGNWNLAYTFTDNAGVVADQGLVAVTAQAQETIFVLNAPAYGGTAPNGTIDATGLLSTGSGKTIELWLPPAGVTNGCLNPGTGTKLGTLTTGLLGSWRFNKTPVAATITKNVSTVYFYAPQFGGCNSQTVK